LLSVSFGLQITLLFHAAWVIGVALWGFAPKACSAPRICMGFLALMGAASAGGNWWLQGLSTTNKEPSKSIHKLDFNQC
jgi:hypothetical protein